MSWSWTLLGWGALIGAVGVLGSYAIGRRAHMDASRWSNYTGFVVLSVVVAVIAAGLDSAWPLVAFGAYVGIANFVVPLVVITLTPRPAPHSCGSDASCGATACSTCPLASQASKA